MSLDYLNQQIEAVRARAKTVQANVVFQSDSIHNNDRLSSEGKGEALAEVKEHAKRAMKDLRAEEDKIVSDMRASLERQVIGAAGSDPATVINYRDAQDRADKIESAAEAARIMSRAMSSGDKTLAAAVANVALSKGYRDVYSQFAAQNPTISAAAKDLAQLDDYFNDGAQRFNRALAYSL